MAVRSPREWTSEGRTIPTAWEVVPDGCAPVILRCVWMYAREAPSVKEQFGWHRGFVEFVPKQSFSFVRGFLFGSEKEAICFDSTVSDGDGDPVPVFPPSIPIKKL